MKLNIQPTQSFKGEVRVPSDKSLTHRSYMLGAIASGESRVRFPLEGEDPQCTLTILKQMGLETRIDTDGAVLLNPAAEWLEPSSPLDCGNSGTTIRLISGLLASRPFTSTLIGDSSLSKRPMGRIAEPLRLMGAEVEGDFTPLTIKGKAELKAIKYSSPVASAQIKSCIMLAGLRADGQTTIYEPHPSRDHSERMLKAMGVVVETGETEKGGWETVVTPLEKLLPFDFTVPADISSAAFFLVAAAMIPGARIDLKQVGINPSRTGILDILDSCGFYYEETRLDPQLGEPLADISLFDPVSSSNRRKSAFSIEGAIVSRLIDEIPVLAVLATSLEGTSVIRNARELRVKESDRIEAMANGLRAMGAYVETFEDGMAITGPVKLRGIEIDAHGDHRIAMAFAIAGLTAEGETIINGAETIATSFPTFEKDLARLCG